MSFRRPGRTHAKPRPLQRPGPTLSLAAARDGGRHIIAWVARPCNLSDALWQATCFRLEELGIFPGQTLEKTGSLGPAGAVIVRVGGSRVAVSRELARSILIEGPRSSSADRMYLGSFRC